VAIRRSLATDVRRTAHAEMVGVSRSVRQPRTVQDKAANATQNGPVALGLYIAHGRESVDVLPKPAADELRRALRGGRLVHQLSNRFERYAAVVYRGRLYRLPEPRPGQPTIPFGRIEAFWAYMQRQLRAKGGVRRERLALYLGEYVWRYQHRLIAQTDQVRTLVTLIRSIQAQGVGTGLSHR